MTIVSPAAGEKATSAWAGSVADQLNATPLIQTGTVTITAGALNTLATVAITFPTAYASAPLVLLTMEAASNPDRFAIATQNPPSTTGATLAMKQLSGSLVPLLIAWAAIG